MDADTLSGPMRAFGFRDHRSAGAHIPDVDTRIVVYGYRTFARSDDDFDPMRCEGGDLQGLVFVRPDGPRKPASAEAPTGKRPIGSWWVAQPTVGSANPRFFRHLTTLRNRELDEDDRYLPQRMLFDGDTPKRPPGDAWDDEVANVVKGQRIPAGYPGLVVAGSEEKSQEALFFPAGGILIAHHLLPSPPRFSSIVSDIQTPPAQGKLHEELRVGIHSNWRVKYLLSASSGSVDPVAEKPKIPTGLCYNLDASGDGSDGYGLMVHRPFFPRTPDPPL